MLYNIIEMEALSMDKKFSFNDLIQLGLFLIDLLTFIYLIYQ